MLIEEIAINRTENYRCGESGKYEPFTDDLGALFRSLQREHGRCVSRIYIDGGKAEDVKAVGWVFVRRRQYEDSAETYLAETWVTLYEREDTITHEHHYKTLSSL